MLSLQTKMALMKTVLKILLLLLTLSTNAQETPLRITDVQPLQPPQLKLHNGDFTSPSYTLSIPQPITAQPSAVADDSLHHNMAANINVYHGLAPKPSDYNFYHQRQFSLGSNYAAGSIATWQGGGVFASSSMNTFPGMGNIATGSVSLFQDFGRFSITGSITGTKYHLDNRLYNNYGVSGQLSYRLNDRLTLNAFGSYQHGGGLYHSMAAMPYMARSNYGATIGVQMSDKFSMEMGAQRYYDPYSHKWITMPILIPQININGSKFGIDVGGLLFQVLHSLLHDYTGGQQYGPADMGKRAPRPGGGTPFLQKASSRHR